MRYGKEQRGSIQVTNIFGDSSTEITISGLDCAATYSIEIAAVNSAGTGVYSKALSFITLGIEFRLCLTTLCTYILLLLDFMQNVY